jgi:hypothetical protein
MDFAPPMSSLPSPGVFSRAFLGNFRDAEASDSLGGFDLDCIPPSGYEKAGMGEFLAGKAT